MPFKNVPVFRNAIESDVTDAALAVYVSPNGKGTGLIAVPIKDGAKVDAELRAIIESCPPETREQFKFNVGKIGNGNLHQMNFAKGLPDNLKRVLDSDKLQFLLTPDAAFIAIGSEAEARLQAAVAAKPGAVPMVIIEASLVKLWPFVERTAKSDADRAELEKTRERIGKGVDKIRFLHLTRSAGESIRYHLGSDLVSVLKVLLATKDAEPAPQPMKER